MFDKPYDVVRVDTADGALAVARWGSGPRTVVAIHGVTASSAEFHALADALPDEVTLLAPDLRGRAGSRDVGPPFGMPAHADDVAAVITQLGGGRVTVVGHSMGGFVAVVAAARHPELVDRLVLVDGGFPLALGPLADLPIEDLLRAVLGPAIERLRMTFPSPEAYLDYWRPHPAFADAWSPYVERYAEADLVADGDVLRPSAREEAVVADTESDLREGVVEAALAQLTLPVTFLRAERGILNQVPPLYPVEALEEWRRRLPQLVVETVPDSNHYTILLSEPGARHVASVVMAS